ncbi:hypothetical protein CC79DRAFT_1392378 [Sarocladium strictum]
MASNAPKDPSRFYCHCGKSFLRKEHLRRHESSHAEPSFVCQVCQRSFTRNDLLRRHVTLHGDKGAPAPRRAKACNACHESKVKCDGGEQCSLCAKRGIICSYDREGQQATSDSMQGVEQGKATSSTSASSITSRADNAEEADRGLNLVIGLLQNGLKVPTRAGLPEELLVVEDWWQRCSDRYRLGFHNEWPVLHYPTIQDFPRSSLWFEASIIMVATWASSGPGTTFRDRALDIHDRLMNAMIGEMMSCAVHEDLDSQPWPWEVWCVSIINIAFALETGRAALIRRADRVFDLTLSDCRQRGAFMPDKIRRHQQVHIPGQFPPWVFKNNEQFHRIAAVMFKIDTCLSLAGNRAPRMRREELHVFLPVPFTLWNAFGLGHHFARLPQQPRAPEQYTISQFLRFSHIDIPVFYEDVQLILCDAIQCTWQLAQTRRMDARLAGPVESVAPVDVEKKLIMASKETACLGRAMTDGSMDVETRALLMWVYTGKEEQTDPGWADSVAARIFLLNTSTLMLQCLANMNLHADVEVLKAHLTQARSDLGEAAQIGAHIPTWAHSPDGRLAFLHAMATFNHYERTTPSESVVHTDICAALAVTTASVIISVWLCYTLRVDEIMSHAWGQGGVNLRSDVVFEANQLPEEVLSWTQSGVPIAAVDGWSLGRTEYGRILARVLSRLQVLRSIWPLCEPVAVAVETQVQML